MNTKDVAVMKAVAIVVREYVSAAWNTVETRLKALEAQPAPKDGAPGPAGEKGLDGQPGASGEAGPQGPQGERGAQGERGEPGPSGVNGEKGLDGLVGAFGPEGPSGRDGRDGMPGVPGLQGEKGIDGLRGADGMNGRDGTLDNLKALFDGERTVTLCFKDGTPIDGGVIRFSVPLYRGVYVEGKAYELADTVTWSGSTWHANETTTTKPGESKAWTLIVKRGRDGRDGKDGGDPPAGLPVVKVGR